MATRHSSRWVLATLWKNTWQPFWQGCRQLPRQAWSEWGKTLLIGLGVAALITYGITRLAQFWHNRGLQAWDESMLPVIANKMPLSFAKAITWESPGNMVYLIPLVISVVAFAAWRSRVLAAASVAASYLLQYALVWIGWGLWSRDRPDLIANGIAAPGLHSFPSGHATVITAVYGFLAYLWIRTSRSPIECLLALVVFIAFTVLTSCSRLVLGVHWPSDIIAGWIVGGSWLLVVIVAFERAWAIAHPRITKRLAYRGRTMKG